MKDNQQEAPQSATETFSGKSCEYTKANQFSPSEDAEKRQESTKNDKGGM